MRQQKLALGRAADAARDAAESAAALEAAVDAATAFSVANVGVSRESHEAAFASKIGATKRLEALETLLERTLLRAAELKAQRATTADAAWRERLAVLWSQRCRLVEAHDGCKASFRDLGDLIFAKARGDERPPPLVYTDAHERLVDRNRRLRECAAGLQELDRAARALMADTGSAGPEIRSDRLSLDDALKRAFDGTGPPRRPGDETAAGLVRRIREKLARRGGGATARGPAPARERPAPSPGPTPRRKDELRASAAAEAADADLASSAARGAVRALRVARLDALNAAVDAAGGHRGVRGVLDALEGRLRGGGEPPAWEAWAAAAPPLDAFALRALGGGDDDVVLALGGPSSAKAFAELEAAASPHGVARAVAADALERLLRAVEGRAVRPAAPAPAPVVAEAPAPPEWGKTPTARRVSEAPAPAPFFDGPVVEAPAPAAAVMAPAAVDLDSSLAERLARGAVALGASPAAAAAARAAAVRAGAAPLGAAAAAAAIFLARARDRDAAFRAARRAAGDDSDDDAAVLARASAGAAPAPAAPVVEAEAEPRAYDRRLPRELRPAAGLGDADAAGAALDALDSTTACAVLDGRTGRRALACAAAVGDVALVRALRRRGARDGDRDFRGRTARESARSTRVARAVRGSSEGAPARFDARASGERKAVLRRVDWDVDVLGAGGAVEAARAAAYDLRHRVLRLDGGGSAPVEAVAAFRACRDGRDVYDGLAAARLGTLARFALGELLDEVADEAVRGFEDAGRAQERARRDGELEAMRAAEAEQRGVARARSLEAARDRDAAAAAAAASSALAAEADRRRLEAPAPAPAAMEAVEAPAPAAVAEAPAAPAFELAAEEPAPAREAPEAPPAPAPEAAEAPDPELEQLERDVEALLDERFAAREAAVFALFEARGVPGDYERAGPDEGREKSERKRAKARKRRLRRNRAHVAGLASPRLAAVPEAPAEARIPEAAPDDLVPAAPAPAPAGGPAAAPYVAPSASALLASDATRDRFKRFLGTPALRDAGLCLDAIAEYRRRHVDSTPEQTRVFAADLLDAFLGPASTTAVDVGPAAAAAARAAAAGAALDASAFDGLERDVDALLAASVEAFRLEKPVVVEGRAPPRPDAAAPEPTPSRGRRAVRYVRDMLRSLSPRKKRPAEGGMDAASADATAAAPAAAPSTPTRRPARGADESALKRLFRSLSPSAPRLWSRSPARSPRRSPPPRARSPARFSLGRLLPRWGRRSRSPDAHAVPSTPEPPSQPPQATT
ncbi:hypothetical protein AURANDRAFT_63629 [Aureococcus anophagefferens]|uniref:Uncharacterized protein n=1 Tax=Aureococcus anophagefferens TaxID=44056 RepID=F0Y6K4_AURAN|nr:hypothetical protein AURANDRAFT_63629 [Aureococcus anophagefferens]EGB09032.1 hypothetical protein AURANDRAFT_63629 [Aureococcus anophagefferens]|eukprot:XP_009036159.1 hypothetical protein AURANDRAFT_63629 [Aureococcus anophagefferens]